RLWTAGRGWAPRRGPHLADAELLRLRPPRAFPRRASRGAGFGVLLLLLVRRASPGRRRRGASDNGGGRLALGRGACGSADAPPAAGRLVGQRCGRGPRG